jgi:hypothetical protein
MMMILLLMGRLLLLPQARLLPLPKPLPLTPRFHLPRLSRQAKPMPRSTRWIGQRPTGHPTGHSPSLPKAFPARRLRCNPMARCVARRAIRCMCKNAGKTHNGSLRVLYTARIGHCRPCPLREQCQEASTTKKPRRVSAVFWPRTAPPAASPPACAALVSDGERASPTAGDAPASPVPLPAVPAQPVRLSGLATLPDPTGVGATSPDTHSAHLLSRDRSACSRAASFPTTRNPCRACSIFDCPGSNGSPAMLALPPPQRWKLCFMGAPLPFIQAFDFPLRPAA